MTTDLPTLRKDLLAARTESERKELKARFLHRVQSEIVQAFDDGTYPGRRRSLRVIRKTLRTFDPADPELQAILTGMGARVLSGEGDNALWELPETAPAPAPGNRRLTAAAFAAIALLLAAGLFILTNTPAVTRLAGHFWPGTSHADCIARADGTFLEILECHRHHGQLPPSP